MTDNRTRLERRQAAVQRELDRRENPSTTERQVRAAQGRDTSHDDEEHDRSKWSTTDHQVFAANGRKPTLIESRGNSATARQARGRRRDE
ncbi:MAG: hypothetical protein BGO97_03775 [Micrococcales bacterium 70-64]|nr:hypothetical protein [Leifsonia sp.]ODU63231.1 MAG: hypothetical protein ABT06_03780 [Leifsonia sp. SCN 70-46]OJX84922.1 MAG: hypothetical protein BGO97_03775 [Micrococcales bacterium 70-64]